MKAGKKNTRGFFSEVAVAKPIHEWLEILRERDPPASEYIPLSQAAERLGYKPDDLLTKGCAGELDIYTPVLEEGAYIWPVTERGIPFGRILGDADPVFMARFQHGDYGVLAISDLEVIKKLKKRVIPQGYIRPLLTLRRIQEWEEEQEERRKNLDAEGCVSRWREGAGERMQALAKTVPWIPSASMRQEIDRQRTVDPWIDVDMLWLDSSYVLKREAEKKSSEEAEQTPAVQPVVHSTKTRRSKLSSLIDQAISASSTVDVNDVWQRLKVMAMDGHAPFTGLVECVTIGVNEVEALFYEAGVVQKNGKTQKYLTKDALGSRLRRLRDKAKKP